MLFLIKKKILYIAQDAAISTGANVKIVLNIILIIFIYNIILYIKFIYKIIKSILYKRACVFGKIKTNKLL